MKKPIHILLALALLALSGCGLRHAEASTVPMPAQAEALSPEAPGDALAGSAWKWAYFAIWFKHGGKLLVRGPRMSSIEGSYTVEGNRINLALVGEPRMGGYYNGNLSIDGKAAIRLPETRIQKGAASGIVVSVDPDGSMLSSIATEELAQAGIPLGHAVAVETAGISMGEFRATTSDFGLVKLLLDEGVEPARIGDELLLRKK